MMRGAAVCVALLLAGSGFAAGLAPPAELTAEQDHRLMMDKLGITAIRPGANGRDPDAPNAANYDEAKANPHPVLPDPLTFANGKRVKNAQDWWKKRRPELVEIYDREIYGRVPKNAPGVTWSVKEIRDDVVGGKPVVFRRLVGRVDNSAYPLVSVEIEAELTTPKGAKGVPVIVEFFPFEFRGRFPAPPPPTWQEQVIARGWAYAILSTTSIQADNGAGLTKGIIGLVNRGQTRKPDDWGALRAWAWGASRLLDHLETVADVDARRAVIEGVSRFGKAALVTMAYEPRYAIGFIGSSGAGGARATQLGRKTRECRGERRVPLDGGQLHQVRGGSADRRRPTGGRARIDRIGRAAPVVHRRGHPRAGRRLGGSQGHVHGDSRRRPCLPVVRKARTGHRGIPAGRDTIDRRGARLSSARRRSYLRTQLADIPRFRRPLLRVAGGDAAN